VVPGSTKAVKFGSLVWKLGIFLKPSQLFRLSLARTIYSVKPLNQLRTLAEFIYNRKALNITVFTLASFSIMKHPGFYVSTF
jgi:hypothetical protein